MTSDHLASELPEGTLEQLLKDLAVGESASRQALQDLLKAAIESLSSQASAILVPHDEDHLRFLESTDPRFKEADIPPVPIRESIAGFVYLTGQTMAFDRADEAPQHFDEIDKLLGFSTKEYIAVPIVRGESVQGVLTFVNRSNDGGAFSKTQIARADWYARGCGVIIDHMEKTRRQTEVTSRSLRSQLGGSDADTPGQADPMEGWMTASQATGVRSEISHALEDLQDDDLELVQTLVDRLRGQTSDLLG